MPGQNGYFVGKQIGRGSECGHLIVHLHEGEAWRPPGYPDVPDRTELAESVLEVVPREGEVEALS